MFQQKSIKELGSIFNSLKSKLTEFDKNSVRDKERDYSLISPSELSHILGSKIPTQAKKKLLLSQIGLLRINLFMEYFERIRIFEENRLFDDAMEIMNDYAESVAIPFISSRKQPSLVKRFLDLIARERTLEPYEYIQKWRNEYQSWFSHNETSLHPPIQELKLKERFSQNKITFNMLYAVSFSDDNFPPSPNIIFYDHTR
jgi:hypothetical protein